MATLTIEVRALADSHTAITLVIPPIPQPLPTILALVFELYDDDNDPSTTRGKREREPTKIVLALLSLSEV